MTDTKTNITDEMRDTGWANDWTGCKGSLCDPALKFLIVLLCGGALTGVGVLTSC